MVARLSYMNEQPCRRFSAPWNSRSNAHAGIIAFLSMRRRSRSLRLQIPCVEFVSQTTFSKKLALAQYAQCGFLADILDTTVSLG
jgi:hypothetical protein